MLENSSLGFDGWYYEAITNNIGIEWEENGNIKIKSLPKISDAESKTAYDDGIKRLEKLREKQEVIEKIIKFGRHPKNIEKELIEKGLLSIIEKEEEPVGILSKIYKLTHDSLAIDNIWNIGWMT